MASDPILYCLTRDRALAAAIDERLPGAIAFFYNDAARLHQAVMLREPQVVLVDTGAVRAEYGDAGLGPVFDFLRHQVPGARLTVRPTAGAVANAFSQRRTHEGAVDVERRDEDLADRGIVLELSRDLGPDG